MDIILSLELIGNHKLCILIIVELKSGKWLTEQIRGSFHLSFVLGKQPLQTNIRGNEGQNLLQQLALVHAQDGGLAPSTATPKKIIENSPESGFLPGPRQSLDECSEPVAVLCAGAQVEAGAELGLDAGAGGGGLRPLVQLELQPGRGLAELRQGVRGGAGGGGAGQLDVGHRVPGGDQLQPAAQVRGESVRGTVAETLIMRIRLSSVEFLHT